MDLASRRCSPDLPSTARRSVSGHFGMDMVIRFNWIEQMGPDMCFCSASIRSSASPKTSFTPQQQSTRNGNNCLLLSYLRRDFTIMQVSLDALVKFTKCHFTTEVLRFFFHSMCFAGDLATQFSKMQYLWDEMLDSSWICITSDMIWSIRTCHAWLRGPFPHHKWRY